MNLRATNPQTGEIFELRDDKWIPVNRSELAGRMAAEGMGGLEAFQVGAGRELSSMGAGIRNLIARARGDKATQQDIADSEAEAEAHVAGTGDALSGGKSALLQVGRSAPYLATMPLGAGGTMTGARGLAASMGIGAALGGVKYSGDQGADALVGALLSAGGYGLGSLAGRTVNLIRNSGAEARAAMMDLGRASLAGRGVQMAADVAKDIPSQPLGELALDVGKHVIKGEPVRAAGKAARAALLAGLKNREITDALIRFAGAGEGRLGHLGAQFGYGEGGIF